MNDDAPQAGAPDAGVPQSRALEHPYQPLAYPPLPPAPPPGPTPARGPSISRRLAAAFIVGALIVGGGIAYGVTRATTPAGRSITINVDNTPVHTTTTNASGVAQQLVPAVGTVIARTGGTNASLGSGVVFAHNGNVSYLLTNNHVISGSKDLHAAMPNGVNLPATLVGSDKGDDLAVVSVPSGSLPMATFGDSSQLRVGQPVVAIGSPLGNQSSVTAGVLSALHRTITASGDQSNQSETLEDVLQTDASINPGNSGGPLADVESRVVGVNVAIAGSSSNIGYSIPSNLAKRVAQELIAGKTVQHPFLGIAYLDAIDAIEAGKGFNGPGVLVTQVTAGTPAASAGFKVNDILVAINGVNIDNGQTLGGLIQEKNVGDKISCTVKRSGQTLTLTATLVERPGNL
jgi:putative serine protease PepD